MNLLALDFGTKSIGLAYSEQGIIFTLPPLPNDHKFLPKLQEIINNHQIQKIYIGLSEGRTRRLTLRFLDYLSSVIKLPIETVEEAVSTIEAKQISLNNQNSSPKNPAKIDSVAAAVILSRVIN